MTALAHYDFHDLPIGSISGWPYGPEGEYHVMPEQPCSGAWEEANITYAWRAGTGCWKVIPEEGRHVMEQTLLIDTDTPLLVAGSRLWDDYTVTADIRPLGWARPIGLVARYVNSRCYCFLGLFRDHVALVLREHERETGGHLPVIAMTAHSMKGDRERCLQAGMDGYVSKPVQREVLFEEIARLLPQAETVASSDTQAPDPLKEPVDGSALLARFDNDMALLAEVTALFRTDAEKLLAEMHRAVDAGDAEVLRRAAHTMRGAVGNFSATTAVAAARELEDLAVRGDLAGAAEVVDRLEEEVAQLESVLSALLAGSPVTGTSGSRPREDDASARFRKGEPLTGKYSSPKTTPCRDDFSKPHWPSGATAPGPSRSSSATTPRGSPSSTG